MKKIYLLFIISLFLSKITLAQNVGIGTTAPTEKLHVAGNIKADTIKPSAIKLTPNAGSGKILTSDSTGNGSWQTNNALAAGNIGYGVWGDCATNGNITDYDPVVDTTGKLGDDLGISVSISGNYAIAGAYANGNLKPGSASIYQYNGSKWVWMQRLTDTTNEMDNYFGISVSISGSYAIVGIMYDKVGVNGAQGSANIYHFNGSSWVLMQKLTDINGSANDYFGESVSISGNYAVVGIPYYDVSKNLINAGSANIYQFNGKSWVLMSKLTDATGAAGDTFGSGVSISGNYVIVGADRDDVTYTDQGSVSIYQYNGSSWALMNKLNDADGTANGLFGISVSISGNYAIVGTNQDNASIYQYDGSNWTLMAKITDPTGATTSGFGWSVSMSGNYVIVGNYADGNNSTGSATIYLRLGNGWGKLQYITDPSGNANDAFGISCAIDGSTKQFLVGAPDYGQGSGKAVFGKIN